MLVIIIFIVLALPVGYLLYRNKYLESRLSECITESMESSLRYELNSNNHMYLKAILITTLSEVNVDQVIDLLQTELKEFEDYKDEGFSFKEDTDITMDKETEKIADNLETMVAKAYKRLLHQKKIAYAEIIEYLKNNEGNIDRDFIYHKLTKAETLQ